MNEKRTFFNHYGFSLLIFLFSLVVLWLVIDWQTGAVQSPEDRQFLVSEALSKALQIIFIGGTYLTLVALFDYFFISRRFKQLNLMQGNGLAIAVYLSGVFIGLGFCIGASL